MSTLNIGLCFSPFYLLRQLTQNNCTTNVVANVARAWKLDLLQLVQGLPQKDSEARSAGSPVATVPTNASASSAGGARAGVPSAEAQAHPSREATPSGPASDTKVLPRYGCFAHRIIMFYSRGYSSEMFACRVWLRSANVMAAFQIPEKRR
jgi:hypothetical protein